MNFKSLKEEFALLWRFYVIYILFGVAGAINAPWMLFYLNAGLSFTQIGIIFGASTLVGLLAEVPTGAIADVFGRKISVGLSFLLLGLTWLLIPFFPQFIPLIIIISIAQLVSTLRSGADEAWAVDYLKQNKKSSMVHLFFMHRLFLINCGLIVGGIISALIVKFLGLNYIWLGSGTVSIFIAGFIFVFGTEKFRKPKKAKFTERVKQTCNHAGMGWNYVRHHPVLFMYVLGMLFLSFAGCTLGMFWQPILADVGVYAGWIGIIVSISGAIGLVAPLLSKWYAKIFKNDKWAVVITDSILIAGVLLFAFVMAPWQGIVLILCFWALGDMYTPLGTKFFHNFIKSKYRATIGSILSMVWGVSALIFFLTVGFVSDAFGMRAAVIIFSMISAISIPFLILMKPKGQKKQI